ncbi:MAG: glycoside hydrolase family 2 TIM barrel-domain containing protein [Bryobacterales bacterium]|nr:glycoside hydrolase family 2 TIM barrel-domain containing protein [Bryobacterales bacterium]
MVALSVENPRLWSLSAPNLYDVRLTLLSGNQPLDKVKSYLGFRSVEIRNGEFLLNGRKVYLKWVLDQGYWPESTLTPPTDAAIQRDIELTKQMGFNGARKHQKVEDPRFLYWADKMGFLVSGEMANTFPIRYDERSMALFTREWMEAVERDINHPSLVMWVPLNESWGVPDVTDRRQRNFIRSLYYLDLHPPSSTPSSSATTAGSRWKPQTYSASTITPATAKRWSPNTAPSPTSLASPCPATDALPWPRKRPTTDRRISFLSSAASPPYSKGSRPRRTPGATPASRSPSKPRWSG